jgi:hypothetical protein
VIVTVPAQPSVAVASEVYDGMVPVHELFNTSVWFAGQVIAGGVLSTRVTVNVQVAVLPFASVAVSVTVVVPTPVTVVPAAGDCVIVTVPAQPSVAVASEVYEGIVPVQELFNTSVWFEGQVIAGGVLSTRVTVNVHVAVLPAASVAVSVTVVVPTPVTVVPAAGD